MTEQTETLDKIKVFTYSLYNVIMHNDDRTSMEFVVYALVKIFNHPVDTATNLMLAIHTQGSAIVGSYPFEIAEQKVSETTNLAHEFGFPLRLSIEQ